MNSKQSDDRVSCESMAAADQLIGVELADTDVVEVHNCVHKFAVEKLATNPVPFRVWSKAFDSGFNTKWKLSVVYRQSSDGIQTIGLFVHNLNSNQRFYSSPAAKSQSLVEIIKCFVSIVNVYDKEVLVSGREILPNDRLIQLFQHNMSAVFDPKHDFSPDGQRLSLVLKFEIKGRRKALVSAVVELKYPKLKALKTRLDYESMNISQLSVKDSSGSGEPIDDNNAANVVTFHVNDKKFLVDKSLLTAKSAVFAQLFNDYRGLESLRVMNITCETFEDFQRFIDTGSVDRVASNRFFDLLVVANRYGIADLEVLCLEAITGDMTVHNVIHYLKQSKANRLDVLMKKAWIFIDKNYKQLRETDEWKQNFKFVLKIGQNFVAKN